MENIKRRQNEKEMLIVQFAARDCFNRAEKLGQWVWWVAIVAELCVFLPNAMNGWLRWVIPVGLIVTEGVLLHLHKKCIENGAMLRNFFDSYVLDLDCNQNDCTEIRRLKEFANAIVRKHKQEAEVQMKNTGRDTLPGVKDWYEFAKPLNNDAAVFECQKQNKWWTKEMLEGCIRKRGAVVGIVVLALVIAMSAFPEARMNIAICSVGLALRAIERLAAYWQFYRTSNDIDAVIRNLDSGYHKSNLITLQKRFEELRRIPVVGSNRTHRKHAQEASVSYSSIVE